MRRLLDNDDHSRRDYDRPNLPCVCGLAEEGCPCPRGPLPGGHCPAAAECSPVQLNGEWRCARPASQGEPCEEGPTADGKCCRVNRCRPVPSLRRRRGRLTTSVVVFMIGALMMAVGSSWRRDALAPGPLTQAHAQLLAGDRCAACHPGGLEASFGLPAAEPELAAHKTQSSLCVACHRTLIDEQHALAAHGVAPAVLASTDTNGVHDDSPQGNASDRQVACAVCHQEHHGAEHELTAISNLRCQSCHAERYDSFAGDHPDFGNWPYERRTRIEFDHNSHSGRHFPAANESFACAACHTHEASNGQMRTAGYEQSCARCHDEDIRAGTRGGLAVLALPTIDRDAIESHGLPIGDWPAAATGDFDGDLPAIMRLLLVADPAAADILSRRGADFSFFDLDPDSAADARDASVLVASLRTLWQGFAQRGHAEILQRAASIAGEAPPNTNVTGAAPVAMLTSAWRAWLAGSEPDAPSVVQEASRQTAGGWLIDHRGLAVRYSPTGHGDPLLQAWIDLAAALPDEQHELRDATLAELAGPNAPGRCGTCHSVERRPNGSHVVNWQSATQFSMRRWFTRFSHSPHLTQPELADCTHCHTLNPDAAADQAPYASPRPTDFVSQFQPLRKTACSTCHQSKAAGDRCTQCHHYHVDPAEE